MTEEASEGGICVEGRSVPPLDRALTLLLLDRDNLDPRFNRGGRHVGGLVALLVTPLCRGGERVIMPWPWGWRPERQRGLRLCLRSIGAADLASDPTLRPAAAIYAAAGAALPPWLVLSRLRRLSLSLSFVSRYLGEAITPAPGRIEIRAAVPPLLSHTQCFD